MCEEQDRLVDDWNSELDGLIKKNAHGGPKNLILDFFGYNLIHIEKLSHRMHYINLEISKI